MATLSSLPQAFISHWSQRPKSRTEIPAISTPRSPAHLKGLPTAAPNFRLGNVRNSHRLRGLPIVSASNTNPSGQDVPAEKGDGGAQGPPFLTILAGVVVFLLICWGAGSAVMWLIRLIIGAEQAPKACSKCKIQDVHQVNSMCICPGPIRQYPP